jgi:hypothetical protein
MRTPPSSAKGISRPQPSHTSLPETTLVNRSHSNSKWRLPGTMIRAFAAPAKWPTNPRILQRTARVYFPDCFKKHGSPRVFPISFPLCSIRKLLNCRDIPSVPTVPGLPVLNNELQLYIARKLKPGTIGTSCVSNGFRRIKLGTDREPSGNNWLYWIIKLRHGERGHFSSNGRKSARVVVEVQPGIPSEGLGTTEEL